MSNFQEQINNVVDQYIELLPIEDDKIFTKSEIKASKFLVAIAKLVAVRDQVMNQKVKKDSLRCVAFNQAITIQKAGDAKAREAGAKADPGYLEVNEEVDTLDNNILSIKTYIDIFTNGHLLYRTLMKNDQ